MSLEYKGVLMFARNVCPCTDKSGNPKNWYPTYDEAHYVKNEQELSGSRRLRIYECPYTMGYHLTHT